MTRQSKMRPAFYTLHALTLNPATSMDALAAALQATEAVQDRHRLSEGAVYTAACRRWLLETGADWRATQQPDNAAAWGGQSDHRLRVQTHGPYEDGAVAWACSCGVTGTAASEAAASAAHYTHVEIASSSLTG